jgi:hypothetical protein
MNSGFLADLLNTTIVTISRVINDDEDVSVCLSNTLVLTTAEGRVFEIVKHMDYTDCEIEVREIFSDEDLSAGFALEPGETLWYHELQPPEDNLAFTIPFHIQAITEIWEQVTKEHEPFLIAIIFWKSHHNPVLGLITAGDEIEIEPIEQVHKRIGVMALSSSSITARQYEAGSVSGSA